MKRSDSKEEDDKRAQQRKDRVTLTHGGELVESIAPEDMQSVNDANCQHERFVRDETETEYNAFICAAPNCNEVLLFSKD